MSDRRKWHIRCQRQDSEANVDNEPSASDKLLSPGTKGVVMSKREPRETDNRQIETLNDVIDGAGSGIFHTYLLFVCGLCMMGVITETLGMSYIITSAECDLQLTQTDKGLVTGAAFFGVVLSSHFWGILSDMWGRRNILLIAVAGCFIFSFLSCFSANIVMFIFTRTLVGVFVAANAAISYALLGEFHSDKTRAKAVTMSGVFMAFGLIYLPALAWAIIPLGRTYTFIIPLIGVPFSSWRVYLLLIALLNGIVFIGLLFVPESPKFLLAKNRKELALESLRRMYWFNGRATDFNARDVSLEESEMAGKTELTVNPMVVVWTQTCQLFSLQHLGSTFKTSFTMGGIFLVSSGLYLWTPDILHKMIQYQNMTVTTCQAVKLAIETKNDTETDCLSQDVDTFPFIATLAMSFIFAVCYIINGLIITKVGKRNLLVFWTTICGVCSLALVWSSDIYAILFFMVVLLTCGCCGSIISAITFDLFPTHIKAMALCFVLMVGRLCAALGSNIIGWLLVANCDAVFYVVGGVLLASTGVGFLIPGP